MTTFSVEALATPNQDPHYVDPRPNFIIKLNRASLVIVNGLGLEVGWLPNLLNKRSELPLFKSGAPAFSTSRVLSTGCRSRRRESTARWETCTLGAIHIFSSTHDRPSKCRGRSPNAWPSSIPRTPRRSARTATRSPRNSGRSSESEALRFAGLTEEQRRVVVYHQSLPYLLDWLGLTQVATIEARAGIPPSPGHVAAVLVTMRESKIKLIVQEGYYQTGPSETLAQLAKARLYVFPGGTDVRNKERYVERIKKLAKGLYDSIAR